MRAKRCLAAVVALAACREVATDATDAATDAAAVDAPIDSPPGMFTLTVQRTGSAGGTVTSTPAGIACGSACTTQVPMGTVMVLTAAADATATFGGWTGPCSGASPTCTVTVNADTTVGASFDRNNYLLTVALAGPGTGTVTSTPAGIDCGTDCTETYSHGTTVTLTAAADSPWAFAGWTGGGCVGGNPCVVTLTSATSVTAAFSTPTGPNIAFVTSSLHTANLGGLAGADAICAARATAAGLPGTYRAFLAQTGVNAFSRLGGASGWVRTDGKPFGQTPSDLLAGRLYHPLSFDENGVELSNRRVWTGTNTQGNANPQTCSDWTSTSPLGVNVAGWTNSATGGWRQINVAMSCYEPLSLYCFGVDRLATVTVTPAPGRRQFISANPWPVGGGIGAADAFCQADAGAAGLTGTYRALLATDGASASSRFNTAGSGFVRPDGIQLTATPADFFFGSSPYFLTQPGVSADGTLYFGANAPGDDIWIGASSMTAAGTAATTCNNWTTTTGSVLTGEIETIARQSLFTNDDPVGCAGSARLLCLQE